MKQFIVWDRLDGAQPRVDEYGEFLSDGVLGRVERENVYLEVYADTSEAIWPEGKSCLDDLEVGECVCDVLYRMSGGKGKYDIYRIQDSKMSDWRYKSGGGQECPFCGKVSTKTGLPQKEGDAVKVRRTCRLCGKEWTDVYRLEGYEEA